MKCSWIVICFVGITILSSCGSPKKETQTFLPITRQKQILILEQYKAISDFKEIVGMNKIPASYCGDSLYKHLGKQDTFNNYYFLLPFIYSDHSNGWLISDSALYIPLAYSYNISHKYHSFCFYVRDANPDSYQAIYLYNCNTNFKVIDSLVLSESYSGSGSVSNFRNYKFLNDSLITFYDKSSDVDYEDDEPVLYEDETKFTMITTYDGHFKLVK